MRKYDIITTQKARVHRLFSVCGTRTCRIVPKVQGWGESHARPKGAPEKSESGRVPKNSEKTAQIFCKSSIFFSLYAILQIV